MTVLVTGGRGFIGTVLVKSLSADGIQVRVLDNSPGLAAGDVRDFGTVRDYLSGVDGVVHLAANASVPRSLADPLGDCATNVLGTVNCLEAARGAKAERFIFTSSVAAQLRPTSPYGAAKLAAEAYCNAYAAAYGLRTAVLRLANVYGPGGHGVIATFMDRIREGDPVTIHGDGLQTRDFIHVNDVVHAIRQALRAESMGGDTFDIATGVSTSILELAAMLGARTILGDRRDGDLDAGAADPSKAMARLRWRPRIDLAAGLAMLRSTPSPTRRPEGS